LRRTAAILAIISAGALLVACGRGGHFTTTGAPARTVAGAATTTAPRAGGARPSGKAQALAYARAVNLTAADVPGFQASSRSHERETAVGARAEHAMDRCLGGAGGARAVAELGSKEFEAQVGIYNATVSSQVSVAPTPAVAAGELAEFRSGHARGCLRRYLDLLFKGGQYGGAVRVVSIAAGTPPAPGMTGSFGWRISSAIALHGIRVPFYEDILGFVDGAAEVTLMSSGLPRPFPAAIEQQLFLLLLKRAAAQRA